MIKICIFGDSIGKGIVLDKASQRYKSLKFDLMEPLKQNKNISLMNYSSFGCTVTKGLSLLNRCHNELREYDAAILEYGGNDCNFLWKEIADAPEIEHRPNNPLDIFVKTYKEIIEIIQNTDVTPVLLTLPPLHATRFFDIISKGLNAQRILKWLGEIDNIYRWQEMYSLAVIKLGKMLGVKVIDIRSEFLRRQDFSQLICQDGMHPTIMGYELIVKTIYEQLV
jgi:lysophospholipase L1-like esterase